MTVIDVSNGQAQCAWFVNGELVTKSVPAEALRYLDWIGTIAHWFSDS
jgi:hypothetical protein